MRLINQRTTVILLGLGLVFGGAAFAQDVPDQAAQEASQQRTQSRDQLRDQSGDGPQQKQEQTRSR